MKIRAVIELVWPWAALLLPLPWVVRRFARPVARPEPALTVPDAAWFGDVPTRTGATRIWTWRVTSFRSRTSCGCSTPWRCTS